MDWSLLISDIPFVATSTWIALGVGLGLGLLFVLVAPWSSTSNDKYAKLWRVWRLRGLGVGLASGALFGSLFVFYVGADRGSPATDFIVLPAVAGGLVGQAAAGAIAGEMGREQINRRVGHSQAVSLRDYVSSPAMWAARILVLSATIALILLYVIAARTTTSDSPAVYPQVSAFVVAPALLVLILTEVGARVLITRPSSAGSVNALRRQDLQRVRIVRDGAGSALSLGVLAFIISMPQLVAAIDPRTEVLALASPAISALIESAAVICVAISIVFSFRARVLPSPKIHRSSKPGEAAR
ncbi:hypothetical protein [Cryobacterium zhongshanensis]|uniref:Uncharacterized protein n=1 Tax=Cryobacterium zhongshanensis TaxID=2928153 RepID=A0AA41QU33_9MICO|nr:hypothetical protein [Cryobacterium zhongshanensis]MCI4656689.1 hypothetical protein [Cryobacterium zhongshanensis]